MSKPVNTPERQARFDQVLARARAQDVRRCVVCGCTDDNCQVCIERTGKPCTWDPDFTRHDVCTACSGVYYMATAKQRFVAALLGDLSDRAELYRIRDFAVRMGNVKRGLLIEGRIDHLKAVDFGERGEATVTNKRRAS